MNNIVGYKCEFFDGIKARTGIIYDKYIYDYGNGLTTFYIVVDEDNSVHHICAIYLTRIIRKLL